ncbi:hypothetical protein BDP27DRAFT_1359913 [Rhodocollybia butyracea]|uniref:Uncharacterized protein n=1 Tax=Rhodocollybia butyracea TaxID=206335 RepID=A0A9P5Q216_9AGAR|nr:hypothetical protein BDP27DRAFT_1359913 [Rhodocollybia butyracea]
MAFIGGCQEKVGPVRSWNFNANDQTAPVAAVYQTYILLRVISWCLGGWIVKIAKEWNLKGYKESYFSTYLEEHQEYCVLGPQAAQPTDDKTHTSQDGIFEVQLVFYYLASKFNLQHRLFDCAYDICSNVLTWNLLEPLGACHFTARIRREN